MIQRRRRDLKVKRPITRANTLLFEVVPQSRPTFRNHEVKGNDEDRIEKCLELPALADS